MNTEAPTEAPAEDAGRNAPGRALALPLLHCQSPSPLWKSSVSHLWPGLPHMPDTGYVSLPGYPFSPQEAALCLADLQAMSEAALSGVPLQALAAREDRPQTAREADEREALRRFAATGEESGQTTPPDTAPLLRTAAQKVLLWAWLLEERQREVRDLSQSFEAGAGHMMDALGIDEDADLAGLHAVSMQLGDDGGMMPPWKLVLENASLFLPEDCTLVVNDPRMAEAVGAQCAEIALALSPLPAEQCVRLGLQDMPHMVWSAARLHLWQAMGLAKAPDQRPWLCRTAQLILPVPKVAHGGQA